jgi:hypothetical protein
MKGLTPPGLLAALAALGGRIEERLLGEGRGAATR